MKTSIVYATIKCIVQHDDEDDAGDVVSQANYEVAIEADWGQQTPWILHTEMVETDNKGECHPTEHYLLNPQMD